ncbi:MAG: hypothetical protein QOD06_1380 [Candidatus Binatota bacterium]|jgi:hypothetical protein|nr:hypothetical protein [Candidatus Binatota bacterium]
MRTDLTTILARLAPDLGPDVTARVVDLGAGRFTIEVTK